MNRRTLNVPSCLAIVSPAFPRTGLDFPDRFSAKPTGPHCARSENQPADLEEKQKTRRVQRTMMKDRSGIIPASETLTRVCMY